MSEAPLPLSEIIILGSGSSTGVPTPSCVTQPTSPPCSVCHKALALPPELNKNYRCNPSLVICFVDDGGSRRFIQIDVGKSFKELVLRWFVRYKIPNIDAYVLTHEHADAVLGLDEIRGLQPPTPEGMDCPKTPIFVSAHTKASLADKFPYLVGQPGGGVHRRVTQLDWRIIDESVDATFDACGLRMTPLPVMHGEDYVSLGFLFGRRHRVAYISDVSRILPETERLISAAPGSGGPVDLLILDSLYRELPHNTHVSLPESLEIVRRLKPKRTLLIGMTHEFDHDEVNAELATLLDREGLDVQLSYDGQRIPLDL